jgi:hypothetical protein
MSEDTKTSEESGAGPDESPEEIRPFVQKKKRAPRENTDARHVMSEGTKTEESDAGPDESPAQAPLPQKKKRTPRKNAAVRYVMAKRKAITSRRGILADGAEVTVGDLEGGKEAFDAFRRSGHIVAQKEE